MTLLQENNVKYNRLNDWSNEKETELAIPNPGH